MLSKLLDVRSIISLLMGQYKGCFQGSLRLPEYDYSQNGAYFVTLVTYQRQHLFGKVIQEEMKLSKIGGIVYTT